MTDYNDGIITRDYRYYSREVIQSAIDAFEEKRLNKLNKLDVLDGYLVDNLIKSESDKIFTIRGRCIGFNSKILYFENTSMLFDPFTTADYPFGITNYYGICSSKTWAGHMTGYRKNVILRGKLEEFIKATKLKGLNKVCVSDYVDCYTEETKQLLKKYNFIRSQMYDSIQRGSSKNR